MVGASRLGSVKRMAPEPGFLGFMAWSAGRMPALVE